MQTTYKGYQEDFLGEKYFVELPILNPILQRSLAPVKGTVDDILRYPNYSILQSATRRFPILTATNIDGNLFQKITRKEVAGSWKKDKRIKYAHQWGSELYKADKSDFDKGHMTKREDVQWGVERSFAKNAAKETFYYTNAIPQHKDLNQVIWQSIENYILHDKTVDDRLQINVFTGPVLSPNDPFFVTEVRNVKVQIPILFWKVVYYIKLGILHQVSFLVGQKGVLERKGIVKSSEIKSRGGLATSFAEFEDAATYQIEIGLLENLTGLTFPYAIDAFQDNRPKQLILQQVSVRGEGKGYSTVKGLSL